MSASSLQSLLKSTVMQKSKSKVLSEPVLMQFFGSGYRQICTEIVEFYKAIQQPDFQLTAFFQLQASRQQIESSYSQDNNYILNQLLISYSENRIPHFERDVDVWKQPSPNQIRKNCIRIMQGGCLRYYLSRSVDNIIFSENDVEPKNSMQYSIPTQKNINQEIGQLNHKFSHQQFSQHISSVVEEKAQENQFLLNNINLSPQSNSWLFRFDQKKKQLAEDQALEFIKIQDAIQLMEEFYDFMQSDGKLIRCYSQKSQEIHSQQMNNQFQCSNLMWNTQINNSNHIQEDNQLNKFTKQQMVDVIDLSAEVVPQPPINKVNKFMRPDLFAQLKQNKDNQDSSFQSEALQDQNVQFEPQEAQITSQALLYNKLQSKNDLPKKFSVLEDQLLQKSQGLKSDRTQVLSQSFSTFKTEIKKTQECFNTQRVQFVKSTDLNINKSISSLPCPINSYSLSYSSDITDNLAVQFQQNISAKTHQFNCLMVKFNQLIRFPLQSVDFDFDSLLVEQQLISRELYQSHLQQYEDQLLKQAKTTCNLPYVLNNSMKKYFLLRDKLVTHFHYMKHIQYFCAIQDYYFEGHEYVVNKVLYVSYCLQLLTISQLFKDVLEILQMKEPPNIVKILKVQPLFQFLSPELKAKFHSANLLTRQITKFSLVINNQFLVMPRGWTFPTYLSRQDDDCVSVGNQIFFGTKVLVPVFQAEEISFVIGTITDPSISSIQVYINNHFKLLSITDFIIMENQLMTCVPLHFNSNVGDHFKVKVIQCIKQNLHFLTLEQKSQSITESLSQQQINQDEEELKASILIFMEVIFGQKINILSNLRLFITDCETQIQTVLLNWLSYTQSNKIE